MLTLEEAILYAEEVAEENEKNAQFYEYRFSYRKVEYYQKKADECLKCASEHRQLAEWLRELEELRREHTCNECRYSSYGFSDHPCSVCRRGYYPRHSMTDYYEMEVNADDKTEDT